MSSCVPKPLLELIESTLGRRPNGSPRTISGGCIHQCIRWGNYFIKTNTLDHSRNFACEADGLTAIAKTGTIRTPEVLAIGNSETHAVLILEYLELYPSGDEARLGAALAGLHQHTHPTHGYHESNFIGATPQPNDPQENWPGFFSSQRIEPMLNLLDAHGIQVRGAEELLARMPKLLPGDVEPSLLHGDLWGGNKGFLSDGTPVLFDPACYYGHACADLAMTTLFGGFGNRFYDSYRLHAPSSFDHPSLYDLYNIYHLLNHAVLFGGGYSRQAEAVISRYL